MCDTDQTISNSIYCKLKSQPMQPYSTDLAHCGPKSCAPNEKLNPQSCQCAHPFEGDLYFRAPSFRELSNATLFQSLETSLWQKLGLTNGSVSLQNLAFNADDHLEMDLALFPPNGINYFNRSEIQRLGFYLSNQTYKPPPIFGPFYFIASSYDFEGNNLHHDFI